MAIVSERQSTGQGARNRELIASSRYMKERAVSDVVPLRIDLARAETLSATQTAQLQGLSVEGARVAISTLASLATIGELDHLGGALELIPAFTLTLALTDFEKTRYTIEHAHTSIGYYAVLANYGFLERTDVIEGFRRGLDIAGHVSWVPGGTELNGGRLGVMIPAAVGQALGLRAQYGGEACVFCHCGDAGWVSGQALDGFIGASAHGAPVVFIMHRNGIQLSGTNKQILDKDPRSIIESLGIRIVEVSTLLDMPTLYAAYREAHQSATSGKPALIYPVGYRSNAGGKVDLNRFGDMYGIHNEVAAFAAEHGVKMEQEIWIPGSLMSWRDVGPMIECLFYVNNLPGGAGHHDGHMKGRDLDTVLANPMFNESSEQRAAREELLAAPKIKVTTEARPAPGSANLVLSDAAVAEVKLPPVGKSISPRAGSEAGYAAVAKAFPDKVFVVSCDLNPSTKLAKACSYLAEDHRFEMSITEQASAIMTTGLAMSSRRPQLNVMSTFAAFLEGIAREGFDLWRYQRNLNGVNEGVNATIHMSHVGACTGRDHFSGWGLDWINLGLTYLPYCHRFYAPADARAAFLAVKDLAAHYGGHIIGIPRDNLPILEKQDGSGALWEASEAWEPITAARLHNGARHAILAFGAPAFLAVEAAETLSTAGTPTDVYVVNGLPLPESALADLLQRYSAGLVTAEDGIIHDRQSGLRGFAGVVASAAYGSGVPLGHIGIVDPRIAPSEGHMEVWAHFGITADALQAAVRSL